MKVKELIKWLKRHDQESEVMIQWGYANRAVSAVSTLKVKLDKRYNKPVVCNSQGEDSVTFLSDGPGVFKHGKSLYENYEVD